MVGLTQGVVQGERASSRGFNEVGNCKAPPRIKCSPQGVMAGDIALWLCDKYPHFEKSLSEREMGLLLRDLEGLIRKDIVRLDLYQKGAEDD